MVQTYSQMVQLGMKAPDFELNDYKSQSFHLYALKPEKGVLIFFICNHCPFVKHIQSELTQLHQDYKNKGILFFGINSNDVENYPEDRPEKMAEFAKENKWDFPYLFDESQQVAKNYQAACTPDFFLFNAEFELVYRGQLDDSRPGNGIEVSGKDLRLALDQLLGGQENLLNQKPSIGCNIKWKSGNAPHYFTGS